MIGQYEKGVARRMGGDIDLINDDIGLALVDTSIYIPDLVNDISLANVTEAAIIAEKHLLGKTIDGTAFRADDLTITDVPDTEPPIGAYVIFKDTGDLNTSWLIYYDDEAPPLPITPDGTDINFQWDTGPNGIFKG